MKSQTTIMDIARHAKVAPSTVSRALASDTTRISKKTRDKIKQIADTLNYTPNKMARGLATGQTNIVGIILPDLYNLFIIEILGAIEERLAILGYESRILQFHNKNNLFEERIRELIQDRAKAIILVPSDLSNTPPQIYQDVVNNPNASLPIILFSDRFLTHNKYTVTGDNILGAKIAVQHLIDLGHRRIALVTGPLSNSTLNIRFKGYKEALKENGIEYDEKLLGLDVFQGESPQLARPPIFSAIDSLLKIENPPTAFFICSDFMALPVIKYLKENNLRVPEDLSIVGFDNIKLCTHMAEPLTTVEFSKQTMANGVVEILENWVSSNGDLEPINIKIEPKLIVRNSTCLPKITVVSDKK